MKKIIDKLGTSAARWCVFAIAAALLITGTIGSALAAGLTGLSKPYRGGFELTPSVEMTIVENGTAVTADTDHLMQKLVKDEEDINVGQQYPEKLTIKNSGGVDAYMRVIVYRYWTDADGNKLQDLDPSLIELDLVNGGRWVVDPASSTKERTIMYYKGVFAAGDESTPFATTIRLSPDTNNIVTQTKDPATGYIKTVYDYDGRQFCIEIVADAVQTHNAEAAIKSSWGADAVKLILG